MKFLERPRHKLVLMTLLVKKYLSVRLNSYGKQFIHIRELLNPVNK